MGQKLGKFTIKSKINGAYLNDGDTSKGVATFSKGDPSITKGSQWMVQEFPDSIYAFKNQANSKYLDGAKTSGGQARFAQGTLTKDQSTLTSNLKWKMIKTGEDGYVVFENVVTGGYLEGYENYFKGAFVTKKPWKGNKSFYFKLTKINDDY